MLHSPDCGCVRNSIPAGSEGCWRSISLLDFFGVSSSMVGYVLLWGAGLDAQKRKEKHVVLSRPYQCELWLSSFPQWSSALSFLKPNETNGSVFEILPSSNELITRTLPFDMQRFLPMGWFIQAVLNIGRCQGEMGGGDITI